MLYLDGLTLVLVAFLLEGLFAVRILFTVCLLADLFGHWYLGTHLLAITLISFPVKGFVNFYRVSNVLQKVVLNGIFALFAYLIIGLIDLLVHKTMISWINFAVEIILVNPIILFLLHRYVIRFSPDIILTE